jgi:hypothetical protein
MSAVSPAAAAASQQAAVEAALVLLERMGLSPADLVAAPRDRAVVPTFAEYVPVAVKLPKRSRGSCTKMTPQVAA